MARKKIETSWGGVLRLFVKNIIRVLSISLFVLSFSGVVSAFTLMSNAGKPAYWPGGVVHYRFNTNASGYFTGGVDHSGTSSNEFAPIRSGFAAWTGLSGLNLSVTEDSSTTSDPSTGDGSNTIKWIRTGWRSLSFRPPTNALAVTLLSFSAATGAIADADVYFNAENFQWAVVDNGSESGYIDVQNIATHEIGHVLGLDHSSESIVESDAALADATMYYASSMGEVSRRNPHQDDIDAITTLYGSASRSRPTITAIDLVANGSEGIQYRITGTNFNDNTEFVLTRYDAAYSDCVSRYQTIRSSTEALVTFDVSNFVNGAATVIAFNDPTQLGTYSTEVTGAGYAATSTSSGGGCVLSPDVQMSRFFGLSMLLMLVSIGLIRRQVKLQS